MAKPFSIQSPEEIAKEYGGNKQKIAQAMQTGIIDPTAGVLAGMFIDRMRSAQMQEGASPPTVAQQVMGGAPSMPAAPPPQMGAPGTAPPMTPPPQAMPAAPMPQDAAPMPQGVPPMPPQGMAAGGSTFAAPYTQGGLDGLPIPDTMFDEPSNGGFNDGYSGGGLVAFARGGMSNLYDDVEYWESGGKQGAVSPKGARGVMQLMPGTMRDPGFGITPMRDDSEAENRRVGREYLDAMYRKYGDQTTALMAYNWGPGNVDKWIKAGRPADMVPDETRKYVSNISKGSQAPIPERDIGTAEGQLASVEDIFSRLQDRFGPSAEETDARAKMMERAKQMSSDEEYEKNRKADMWQTLAEIGFNMASSKSPYLLQAVGEAASAAMPGARADKKERKAIKDRGLDLMVELGAANRKEAQQLWGMAVDAAKTNMQQQQFEQRMKLDERQIKLAEDKLAAEITAAERAGADPEKIAAAYVLKYAPGTPQYEAAKRFYDLRYGSRDGRTSNAEDIKERIKAGGGGVPAVGTVQDGYKFKGGDPSEESSWEKVG